MLLREIALLSSYSVEKTSMRYYSFHQRKYFNAGLKNKYATTALKKNITVLQHWKTEYVATALNKQKTLIQLEQIKYVTTLQKKQNTLQQHWTNKIHHHSFNMVKWTKYATTPQKKQNTFHSSEQTKYVAITLNEQNTLLHR